jgi:hypothetical protein
MKRAGLANLLLSLEQTSPRSLSWWVAGPVIAALGAAVWLVIIICVIEALP